MKTLRPIYTILFLLIFSGLVGAKSDTSKSDNTTTNRQIRQAFKAVDAMAYAKVVRLLDPIYDKGSLPDSAKAILAMSQLKIKHVEKAELVYSSIANLTEEHLYYYAEVLKYNGKYHEIDAILTSYPQDALAKIKKLLKQDNFQINKVDFNSEKADFGAVIIDGEIVFTSAREVSIAVKRKYAWTEDPYLSLFSISKDGSRKSEPEPYYRQFKSILHDGPISLTPDGQQLLITRSNVGLFPKTDKKKINHFNLLYANRLKNGSWSKAKEFEFNGKEFSTGHGYLSPDGNTLYFASNRAGGLGGSDIWYVKKEGEGWSAPINMGSDINTEGDEMFPVIGEDNRFYFASNGHVGLGGLDLFVATKLGSTYVIKNLGAPLNSRMDDFSIFFEKGEEKGYFASNRPGGKGDDDIYQFQVISPIEFNRNIIAEVIDDETKTLLRNVQVTLLSQTGDILKEITTDNNGVIKTEVPLNMQELTFTINNSAYDPYERKVEIAQLNNHYTLPLIAQQKEEELAQFKIGTIIESEILYDLDKWFIRKDAAIKLDKVVDFLKKNPHVTISIESHTDVRGSVKWNEALAKRRAKSAKKYLVKQGIQSGRIYTNSFGEERPKVNVNDQDKNAEQLHESNRRSEIRIKDTNYSQVSKL